MRPLSHVVALAKEQNDVNSQQSISCPPPPLLATNMSSSINKPPLIGSSCGGISIPPTFTAAAPVKIIPSYTSTDKDVVISNNDNNILDESNNKEHLFTISSSTTDDQSIINNKVHFDPCSSHKRKNMPKTKSSDFIFRPGSNMLDVADHRSLTSTEDVLSSSSSRTLQNHHQSDDKTSTQITTGSTNVDIMNDLSSSTAPLDISGGCIGDGADGRGANVGVGGDVFLSFRVENSIDLEDELKRRASAEAERTSAAGQRTPSAPASIYLGMFASSTKPKPFQRKRPNLSFTVPEGELPSLKVGGWGVIIVVDDISSGQNYTYTMLRKYYSHCPAVLLVPVHTCTWYAPGTAGPVSYTHLTLPTILLV